MQSNGQGEPEADGLESSLVRAEKREDATGRQALDFHRTEIFAYPIDVKKLCVLLPKLGRPFSNFANEMGRAVRVALGDKYLALDENPKVQGSRMPLDPSDPDECFLCMRNGVVGKIAQEKGVARQHSGLVFAAISPEQAITELERWIQTGIEKVVFGRRIFVAESMTRVTAATLLASSQFHQYLPRVDRIFDFAIPYGFIRQKPKSGNTPKATAADPADRPPPREETFVAGVGKSKLTGKVRRMELGFNHYSQKNDEVIQYYCNRKLEHYLSLEQAKVVLEKLFREFTFADDDTPRKMSRTHAIARLLTPYCQGLMGWRKRSPLWLFTADRPGAGKDFLAMLTPLIHSHWAIQDPPLETDDEVKRRITAALASGRRFMHFANCRDDLNNHPSLEAAITSEFWSDRIIRSSNEVTVPNEIIFSISYNGNLPISEDLITRSRQIRLLGKPDGYKYQMPDLHDLVTRFETGDEAEIEHPITTPEGAPKSETEKTLDAKTRLCRRNILAAIDALIRNWAENNCPHCPTVTRLVARFPEWSRVVGGIMLAADLGNPCEADDTLTAANVDDWMDDFAKLAEVVSRRNEKQFFRTPDFIERFIEPKLEEYPVLQAYIELSGRRNFAIQFGKYLKRRVGTTLEFAGRRFVLIQHEYKNPAQYCFVDKGTNATPSTASAAEPAENENTFRTNEHIDQYLVPDDEIEEKQRSDYAI